MPALETPVLEKGWKAHDFSLLGVDGEYYNISNVKLSKHRGLVVAFICNHCPYVKSIADKIARDANSLREIGVAFIAINSNDVETYPEDSYEKMKDFAAKHGFEFPYVIDDTQEVAKAYGAVCTPDFFGFNKMYELQYRGRLDSARREDVPDAQRELWIAMQEVAEKGHCDQLNQVASIGCSIKWKARD